MTSKAARQEAAVRWDSIRRTAARLDKLQPGAGDQLLRRAALTLAQVEREALSGLSSFPDR